MNSNSYEKKMMEESELCSFALTMASGSVTSMVLKAVLELNVLELIKQSGPGAQLSPAQIAAQLPTKNPDAGTMLDRMLRLLASYELLSCSTTTFPDGRVERLYGLAPVCQFLTKNEDGASLAAMVLIGQEKMLQESWHYLKDAVLEGGIAFEKAHGKTLYEFSRINAKFNTVFHNGMSNYSSITIKKMLEVYKGFEGVSTLVDVGGGTGDSINMIVTKYPKIKGINFDLPHVLKDAPSYNGVTHVAGDMFKSVPKGDTMLMKWITTDWNDELLVKILKNCYKSLPKNGKVLVCDYILPVAPETNNGAKAVFLVDCILLANFVGGRGKTEQEFHNLATNAGFQGFKVAAAAFDFHVMEFIKIEQE